MCISHTPEALLVSIHAPREGCDMYRVFAYPLLRRFQFTHPGRGATSDSMEGKHHLKVSIHAPREGCDVPSV